MRAFFADGVNKLHIPWAVEGLPALLHLSLLLFFSGLLIFLFNINNTVFSWVIWWIGIFVTLYGLITVMPIFRHDSPYYSPLSGSVWLLYAGIRFAIFRIRRRPMKIRSLTELRHALDLENRYRGEILGGVEKAAEETVPKESSAIDIRILESLGTLGEDGSLEKFFDAIPGFFNSSLVEGLQQDLTCELRWTFGQALGRFLRRTLSSNSILDSVKTRRFIISIDAADAMNMSGAFSSILDDVVHEQLSLPQSIEAGHALARWRTGENLSIADSAQQIVTKILMSVSNRDDHWIALAKDQFGLPEHVLRDNVAHGDNSVLLSILIHALRQAIHSSYDCELLPMLSQFDIHHTVPELQHEFCALWNEIVLEARNEGDLSRPVLLLYEIRHAYVALHQGTEATPTAFSTPTDPHDPIPFSSSSYPLCTLTGHRPDSTDDGPPLIQLEAQPLLAMTTTPHISTIPSEASPVLAAVQQVDETIITPSPTDLAVLGSDNTSPLTRPFPSASPTTEPVHILPQVSSVTYSSILIRDPNPPVPIEESAVPTDPTTCIHTTKARETSHTATAASLTCPHPGPVLVTTTPFTLFGLPSAAISGLADAPNTFQPTTTAPTLSHPLKNNKEDHTATPSATTYISEISSTTHFIPHTIPSGSTLERHEEATQVTPIVVSQSQSSPMPMLPPHSNMVPEEVSSFLGSPLIQPDSTSRALGSPSSSATARSRIAQQVTSALDAHPATNIEALSGYDDTRDWDVPIPTEVPHHPIQSTPLAPDTDRVTSQAKLEHGQNLL